jgi:hypothetical protein
MSDDDTERAGDEDRAQGKAAGSAPGPSQADFISAVVLALLGIYVLLESIAMPYYEEGVRGPISSPGLTPGLLGAALIVLSGLLMFRAWGFRWSFKRIELRMETVRVLTVIGILLGYVALIKPLGYVAATFLMLAVFQIGFMARRTVKTVLVWGLGLSAVVTGALYYVFGKVFLIPLP